jgi:hypothetical protein
MQAAPKKISDNHIYKFDELLKRTFQRKTMAQQDSDFSPMLKVDLSV